ncbi:helix-turn-helix domain-containing protein [uncultured Holdemanella sp.]|uniref:helix-turn-helix domain-containing protein n=1 Tax=uncultured Holdemanella sp. TaxID=1763549 RepID=UPI0025F906DD|nr:helix-turn-helix domain-containing protein [uncultured Holdemanella sp.]
MSTIRVNNTKGFTVMSNYHLQDKEISLKAKGLLGLMLSLPSNWDYSVNGLVAIVKENKAAVQTALKELEEHKYLKRTRVQDETGRFDYIYDIYEKPYDKLPWTENRCTDIQCTENRCTENQPQINTNKQNTKELNTNRLNTNNSLGEKGKKETVNSVIAEYTQNQDLQDALHGFVEMRNKARKPLTARAMKLSLNKLTELALDDVTKIAIVNQSIMHNWLTFYKLQNNSGQRQLTRKEMGYAF